MPHLDVPQFLGLLAVMLAAAKLGGAIVQRFGQPAVLGELVAGVLLGPSVVALVDPHSDVLHLLAELGVVLLLFAIGLETDLQQLMKVGGESFAVAVVGVALPFALGYGVCWALGLNNLVALVAGAALTATSVGITARVLSDLNRLHEPEGQIILGAAVIDDIVGLVILAVISGLAQGQEATVLGVAGQAGAAFGFLAVVLIGGRLIVPIAARAILPYHSPKAATIAALIVAFGLAWLASAAGSAVIIGAFAAGVLLRDAPQAHDIEAGVSDLGRFFVPLFFVVVGAAVDVRVLNPFDSANHSTLLVGGLLIVAAIIGKYAAGYAPFWFAGDKRVIGVGMIPRGEVGLIFAQMGLATGVLNAGLFSAVTLMVMATTFIAPPLLKALLPPGEAPATPDEPEAIEEMTVDG